MCIDSSHYYRLHWYWAGEGEVPHRRHARADDHPGRGVEEGRGCGPQALGRVAAQSPRNAKVVEILKQYNADMVKAGAPYRY